MFKNKNFRIMAEVLLLVVLSTVMAFASAEGGHHVNLGEMLPLWSVFRL